MNKQSSKRVILQGSTAAFGRRPLAVVTVNDENAVNLNGGLPARTCIKFKEEHYILGNQPTQSWLGMPGNTANNWEQTCSYMRYDDKYTNLKRMNCRNCGFAHTFPNALIARVAETSSA